MDLWPGDVGAIWRVCDVLTVLNVVERGAESAKGDMEHLVRVRVERGAMSDVAVVLYGHVQRPPSVIQT